MKVLFVCSQGENRSRTAKELFSKKYNTKSAGLFALVKENRVNKYVLDWADLIIVMGEWQEPEKMFAPFAGESSVDIDGNVYFTHHFYKDNKMLEADYYVAHHIR